MLTILFWALKFNFGPFTWFGNAGSESLFQNESLTWSLSVVILVNSEAKNWWGRETGDTVDGSEIPNHHLGCIKPCKLDLGNEKHISPK